MFCSVLTPEWTLDTNIDLRGVFWGVVAVIGLAGQTLLVRATVTKGGIEVMSMNVLLEDTASPVVWRGPVISGARRKTADTPGSCMC